MNNSKTAFKVALCGVFSAFSAVLLMLTSVIPVGTYALPVISGILLVAVYVEFSVKWALGAFFSVSFLSFLLSADKEAVLYFIMFFGYYPVVKAGIEKIPSKVVCIIIKFLVFNAGMVGSFFVAVYVLGVPIDEFSIFGVNIPLLFLAAGNAVFWFYDKCVLIMTRWYIFNIRNRIIKK